MENEYIYVVYYNAGPCKAFKNRTSAIIYLNEIRRADYKGARMVKMEVLQGRVV